MTENVKRCRHGIILSYHANDDDWHHETDGIFCTTIEEYVNEEIEIRNSISIRHRRIALEQELREAIAEVEILKSKTVVPLQIKLKLIRDECPHTDYKNLYCPDCGKTD